MSNLRFSMARLMGVVVAAAVGLAALVKPSPTWAGAIFLVTSGVLGLAIVGALYRRGAPQAWWVGFCVFGWGYLLLVASSGGGIFHFPSLPTSQLLTVLRQKFGIEPLPGAEPRPRNFWDVFHAYYQIGHALWALLAGVAGGTLARAFLVPPADRSERPEPDAPIAGKPPGRPWLRPALLAWGGLVLACSAAAIRWGSDAEIWAGAAFFLTCGLIGMAGLVAIFGRGRRRQAGVGAALFGAGYMLLVFTRAPYVLLPPGHVRIVRSVYQPLPTSQLLTGLRRWTAAINRGSAAANARIMAALEQSIPMTFRDPTPIQDVLRHIALATATPTQPGISIYLDPIGLAQAERTPQSTVTIDLPGVPLKTSLRLCLDQLGLGYQVEDGCLWVISVDEDVPLRFESPDVIAYAPRRHLPDIMDITSDADDPFLIVGHCLLALLAAGFGAVAAPLVAEPRVRSSASSERT
jgi:hypothetical protein